jgi:hypothetical protein
MDIMHEAVDSAANACSLNLIDALSVPTVGAAVLSSLIPKTALRQTCSALCALVSMVLWDHLCSEVWLQDLLLCCELQVDQHIEALRILCRGREDVVMARKLARKAFKPKKMTLDCSGTDSSSFALTAFFANEQHHPMLQRVQYLVFDGYLPKRLPQVSKERIQ